MQEGLLYPIIMFCAGLWLFKLWLDDARAVSLGTPNKNGFSGATYTSKNIAICGACAGVCLLIFAVFLENITGTSESQTKVSVWAVFGWIAAAFIEELIFRGYLVIDKKGKFCLITSIFVFSLIFTICHPFFWDYTIPENADFLSGKFSFDFSSRAWVSSVVVFVSSLVFYILRFMPQNVSKSLIPCILAHLSYNLGTFFVKAIQGYVEF